VIVSEEFVNRLSSSPSSLQTDFGRGRFDVNDEAGTAVTPSAGNRKVASVLAPTVRESI
jgi:hypothetical protein